MTEASEANAKRILPLYHGPLVKIRINPSDNEYTISKSLLCTESPVFSAMFEGKFLESQQQTATLDEMEGVVSVRSVEALFQWLYLRLVKFDIEDPREHISAAMELDILITNPHPKSNDFWKHVDTNTYSLTPDHIISGTFLPQGHPVRRILAAASVEGYLQSEDHKFVEETQDYPTFGADLLQEIRIALNGLKPARRVNFEDPISGRRTDLASAGKL
ncbi:hypothetical protein BDW59DRAFT_172953 [Aspergillus cavernicola]|uniref:BTB domain-containing protein n=1 Tax=Aspergillus cavernicola TaxID=176166 RepID=A0ABR4I8Y3_9EURO